MMILAIMRIVDIEATEKKKANKGGSRRIEKEKMQLNFIFTYLIPREIRNAIFC
jgi:hypothetical protein